MVYPAVCPVVLIVPSQPAAATYASFDPTGVSDGNGTVAPDVGPTLPTASTVHTVEPLTPDVVSSNIQKKLATLLTQVGVKVHDPVAATVP